MPIFRTTKNILVDQGEYFDENWMDTPYLQLPEHKVWDYSREMQIEDVDIWEVISEYGGAGVYASWNPYAEFYLLKLPLCCGGIRTFYGKGAQKKLLQDLKKHNLVVPINKVWVEPEDMWLYE